MIIAIILYLLGCYMHYHFAQAIISNDEFLIEVLVSIIWPLTTLYYIIITIYKKGIKNDHS